MATAAAHQLPSPRFEIAAVRKAAGDKTFARGEAYFGAGQVRLLSVGETRVLARVEGSEDYRTELTGRGCAVGGSCSCPAFEDQPFCKHMVAVALAANAVAGPEDGTEIGLLERIRAHLQAQPVDALIDMLLAQAEQDAALFRRLELAVAASETDDETLEGRLRELLGNATRISDFLHYREAPEWADGVEEGLDAVAALLDQGRAAVALRLATHAIDLIEEASERLDDSDGHCGGLLHRACEIHLAAAVQARPEPTAFAGELFERALEDEYGLFGGAASTYADALGDSGVAEFRRLAAAAWRELAPFDPRVPWDSRTRRLAGTIDDFAERDGDLETRLALRATDLSSPWRYLELAQFCLAHGREQLALRYAEEGVWVFEDQRPDPRLLQFLAGRLQTAGRETEAETLLKRAFAKAPDFELYRALRALAGPAAVEHARAVLQPRLKAAQPSRWGGHGDFLAGILMTEGLFGEAWELARSGWMSEALVQKLARASEASHPRESLAAYILEVERLANLGGHAYSEAAELVGRISKLQPAEAHAAYVADLKNRFSRRRNLLKLLG